MSIPTKHPYAFDPTYGYGLEALLAIRPPEGPAHFDAFWQARYADALGIDPKPRLSAAKSSHPDWRVHDLSYTSTGGFRIGGWLLLPRAGKVRRGLVVGHGYGGREQPDFDIPVTETAVLFLCFRGLSRSSRPPISSDPGLACAERDRQAGALYPGRLRRGSLACRLRSDHALSWAGGRIGYSGISFGGGIGALAHSLR